MASSLSIIVPLYIYPLEQAWEPLFSAARAHPRLQFLVIINPNNGPGDTALPDASYAAALRELTAVANIHPIGYVYCSYGRRELDAIKRDVDLYRGWNSHFKLDGIFVDEAPSQGDHFPQYMAEITEYANTTWQSFFGRRSLNVYNPGVVANPAYFDTADYIVAFEQSEAHWNLESVNQAISSLAPNLCPKSLAIIHTCALPNDGLVNLVKQVKRIGFAGLYVTDQAQGGFTHWPSAWDKLLDIIEEESFAPKANQS